MIRVSCGPISLYSYKTDDFRRGPAQTKWGVNSWAYTSLDLFNKLRHFQSEPTDTELRLIRLRNPEAKTLDELTLIALRERMDSVSAFTPIYQFNANNPNFDGYHRMAVGLASNNKDRELRYVNWFEAYVKYPLLKAVCKVLNISFSLIRNLKYT